MASSKFERVINQLENFNERELNFIIERACAEKQKKEENIKLKKLIKNFEKAWEDLISAGVVIRYYDEWSGDDFRLDTNTFSFE